VLIIELAYLSSVELLRNTLTIGSAAEVYNVALTSLYCFETLIFALQNI